MPLLLILASLLSFNFSFAQDKMHQQLKESIKLESGALVMLDQFQEKLNNDGKPFKLDMICYKNKNPKIPKSMQKLECKYSKIKFIEKDK